LFVYMNMQAFYLQADPSINKKLAGDIAMRIGWDESGNHGLGALNIHGKYLVSMKIHYYDESVHPDIKRSIVFSDHYCDHSVEKVNIIADAFEAYLNEKKIPYERINREKQ